MKKYMMLAMMVAAMGLTACGQQGNKGDTGAPGPTGPAAPVTPTPVVDEVQEDIDAMIAQKNADRAILAQAPLTNGLSCTVQKVSGGQCLRSDSGGGCASAVITTTGTTYTYLYKGSFNQANSVGADPILLLPTQLRPVFQGQNFKIVCSGQIVVRESNYYDFSLDSDDGSLLYVNGSQVINNDANHGMTLKSGTALLYRGVQAFQVQYAQTGGGNYGLVLQAGGASIDPKYYFH